MISWLKEKAKATLFGKNKKWEPDRPNLTVDFMTSVGKFSIEGDRNGGSKVPGCAAIFGASGGIGAGLTQQLQQLGVKRIYTGSRSGNGIEAEGSVPFAFDLINETSIKDAAALMRDVPPQWVIISTGKLTLEDGAGPERTYKRIDPQMMAEVLAVNTIGPALIAKHVLPLMAKQNPFVFAALSARVGSITDNGLGGWHSYRASKAALNMLIKNFAIEMGRTHPQGVIVGLHPGTVDTALSEPFQKGLADGQLTQPPVAAANLIDVLSGLSPEDSGRVFDFAGKQIDP